MVSNYCIGLQVKPFSSGKSLNDYQWIEMHEKNHAKFQKEYNGKVFFIFSVKGTGKKKRIFNTEAIKKIQTEIKRLGE